MAWATKTEVKFRLLTAIPSGVTKFDIQLDEAIDNVSRRIQEKYRGKGATPPAITTTPPSVIADAVADLAASTWIKWNWENYGPSLGEKQEILEKNGWDTVDEYLEGTQEKKYWAKVNSVDSAT